MDKVSTMATNFSYVAHQAEQGSKSFTELDAIKNDGLNAALYNVSNSVNQEFLIDEHGITGRQWDDMPKLYGLKMRMKELSMKIPENQMKS